MKVKDPKLLELPAPVRTRVYFYSTYNGEIFEHSGIIVSYTYTGRDLSFMVNEERYISWHDTKELGKTMFFSKEEYEDRIKKILKE